MRFKIPTLITSSDVENKIPELEWETKTSYLEAKLIFIGTQSHSGHYAFLKNVPEI